MKTITINVSEPVYRDFQEYARTNDRTASELIREAMEDYRQRKIHVQTSLRELEPTSAGRVIKELTAEDDLLSEMMKGQRR
jgi:predicted transcriptional regulator